ncbi:MAG: hypothetical protein ABIW46_09530 [Acidimicrobiales bacterium]
MLSERSRAEWQALVGGPSGAAALLDRHVMAAFLVGVHVRGEEVAAHELADLVDRSALPTDEREGLIGYVESAFHLLEAYDRSVQRDEDFYDQDQSDGDAPFGTFVI